MAFGVVDTAQIPVSIVIIANRSDHPLLGSASVYARYRNDLRWLKSNACIKNRIGDDAAWNDSQPA